MCYANDDKGHKKPSSSEKAPQEQALDNQPSSGVPSNTTVLSGGATPGSVFKKCVSRAKDGGFLKKLRGRSFKTTPAQKLDFKGLVEKERGALEPQEQNSLDSIISMPGNAGEPWVAFTAKDRVGLALSGGGIRSATFNLGLLQALQQKGVLRRVDYLSTVSGGGYVGGLWTRWRRAVKERNEFSVDDITDLPSLAGRLGDRANSVSQWLQGKLTRAAAALADYASQGSSGEALIQALVVDLNEVIRGSSVYDHDRFSGVSLRADTQSLLSQHNKEKKGLQGEALKRLNRLLLEDALGIGGRPKDFLETASPANALLSAGPKEIREPAEVRHLREFSRFLIPRKGLTAEFWGAAITILTGLVPSLLAGLAAVLLAMAMWTYLASWMLLAKNVKGGVAAPSLYTSFDAWIRDLLTRLPWEWPWLNNWINPISVTFTALTVFALVGFELIWRRSHRSWWCVLWTLLAMVGSFGGWWLWNLWRIAPEHGVSLASGDLGRDAQLYSVNWLLFGPSFALAMTLAILTLFRLLLGLLRNSSCRSDSSITLSASLERTMGRLLAIQVAWVMMATVWELARWLNVRAAGGAEPIPGVTGLTAVLAFVFYRIQHWLSRSNKEGSDRKALEWLKPWAPQLLANGIVTLLFVLAAVVILDCGLINDMWPKVGTLVVCLLTLLSVLVLFDPMSVGLHEFYRARLARCYLGAGQANGAINRASVEHPSDDMRLKDDSGKPIHLICCAANHLSGDPLSTLHRGARSAVLSRHGITIGDHHIADDNLWLSSALTASAAAFNSLMGELNMTLGRAVAFVMTALNLRLGLWVKNPGHAASTQSIRGIFAWLLAWFRGRFFVKELFAWAQCAADRPVAPYVHLSDGGHFENLALYELIRRHCRYIMVADAGEDHAFAFTDFGRAVRRVREDFGVEVDIDLAPLRPGPDGLSRQHVVAGTLHYDGVVGTDKGTIVYFKPTLTGDEPVDVLQYRRRKPIFPHETTGDQFFDEAQWESYRRLGQHIGNASLRMLEEQRTGDGSESEAKLKQRPFRNIRLHWQRVPWMQGDRGIRLCEHATALEGALREHARPALWQEFAGGALSVVLAAQRSQDSATTPAPGDQTGGDALLALQAFKFMEETWLVCDLDSYWSHPLAANWMGYLQRWAAMPTLRQWWPLLKPLLGSDFQKFGDTRLHLPAAKPDKQIELKLDQNAVDLTKGFAWGRFGQCYPGRKPDQNNTFSLDLMLPDPDGLLTLRIQVSLAFTKPNGSTAEWQIDDLFVPPELRGGGFTSALLGELIRHFKESKRHIRYLKVYLGGDRPDSTPATATSTRLRRDQAGRQEQIELIDFYRSRGFQFDCKEGWEDGQNTCMVLDLQRLRGSSDGTR